MRNKRKNIKVGDEKRRIREEEREGREGWAWRRKNRRRKTIL